jgi:hypothetical protein
MKITPIKNPLSGERVVNVHPEIETFPEKDWRRRLNNYTGRALTHTALIAEQKWHSGRIASMGQLVSPGVIDGLEVDGNTITISGKELSEIHVSPGSAVTVRGEIITLTRPTSALLKNMFVYDHSLHPETSAGETVEKTLYAEQLPTLGELLEDGGSLPRAVILILEPLYGEINFDYDDKDPCELDPANFAFENWQTVDAARLVLYTWPDDWLSLPAEDDQWRNRIAHSIFQKERSNSIYELHPWEKGGVPIALIAFDGQWNSLFIDRNAVARAGGKRRRTGSIMPDVGNRFLWQAQFQQFNEHLAGILTSAESEEQALQKAEGAFRYLPPVGVLPKNFIELRGGKQEFFPVKYHTEAVPVPCEQLDVAMRDSSPLLPFDVHMADRVQVLVPVPQTYYEPDLLKVEEIDIEFDETIRRFTADRDLWLGRRLDVRRKASALYKAIKGEPLMYKDPDPDAVDNLELSAPFERAVIEEGSSWRYLKGREEPPARWTAAGFNDSQWLSGATGLGYGDGQYETELADMEGFYVSLFCRRTFMLDEDELDHNYKLSVITSGGFYAYLNGTEIKKHNMSDRSFNVLADRQGKALSVEIDLQEFKDNLKTGVNVLAIQVHNYDMDSTSFTFIPRLTGKQFVADIGEKNYGTEVTMSDEEGGPVLDDQFEPSYTITKLEELKNYLDTKTPLSDEEIKELEKEGVSEFIDFLQRKVDKANDKVDFGFVRLQTDIYRVRQFILGSEEGTKLATSPVLASIARGESAAATKEEIEKFVRDKKISEPPDTGDGPAGSGEGRQPGDSGGGPRSSGSVSGSGITTRTGSRDLFISGESGSGMTPRDRDIRTGGISSGTPGKEVLIKDSASSGALLGSASKSPADIEEQSHIVGGFQEFRNVTVGERLKQSSANESRSAGVAGKAEVIQNIIETGLTIDDLEVPGFRKAGKETFKSFKDIKEGKLIDQILAGKHDDLVGDDEASFFNSGIRAMENSAAVLRIIEGRIHAYKRAIAQCKKTETDLRSLLKDIDQRLKDIGDELAEARHDVSVARALKAEEQARIDEINKRRDTVIEEHVPFLVFRRPRLTDIHVDVPVHTLNPDLSEAPVPVCNISESESPQEISAMMDILREAPVKWFTISDKILKRLNRLDDLRVTLKSAQVRARARSTKHPLLNVQYETMDLLSQGIGKALLSSQQLVFAERQKTSAIDLAKFTRIGWNETASRAANVVSLGDVIDGNHGRVSAGREAARELDRIGRSATCLYVRFGQVLPSIRLDWAERLSQFDTTLNLRNLYSLPRWGEVEYIERHEMQTLVDWLYQRVDPVQSEAVSLVSDLIRICILLASHAPVNKIIAGHIPEPATVRVGSKIDIVANLARVRIGMNVMMQSGGKTVARGTVRDIVGGQVTAQVMSTIATTVSMEKNAKVQIAEPRSMGSKQVNMGRLLF